MTRSRYSGSSGIEVGEVPARIQPPTINSFPHTLPMLFDNASEWLPLDFTYTDVAENLIASETGNQVKFTMLTGKGVANIDAFRDFTAPYPNFAAKTQSLIVDWYLYPGTGASDPDKITSITIQLLPVSGYPAITSSATLFAKDSTQGEGAVDGWNRTVISPQRWADAGGAADLTEVQRIKLRCSISEEDATPSFLIGRIATMEPLTKPYVIYTFDDATADQIEAANYLAVNQIPGTFYTVGGQVGNPTFMTLDQVKDLQQAGHLVANHTFVGAPGIVWNDWTKTERRDRTIAMREWMFNNGFTRGADTLATPGGSVFQFDEGVEDIISIIRSTTAPYTGFFTLSHPASLPYIHVSAAWSVADEDQSIVDCNQAVDDAITYNQIAVIMVHGVTDIAKFKTHLDATKAHIDASEITAIDMADLLTEF